MAAGVTGVTVGVLIYKSTRWLDFVLEGLAAARNSTPYQLVVLANDATPEVLADSRVTHRLQNPDPSEHYLARVYRAWNYLVMLADTKYVCLLNSDMYVSDGWLDALMAAPSGMIPTSLLVESGALPSAFPEYVRDFGRTPATFDRQGWRVYVGGVWPTIAPGRLYMPALFDREQFLDVGGYPIGNVDGVPGDQILFRKLADRLGLLHVTCHGSIVYHVQEGELRDESDVLAAGASGA